MSEQIYLPMDCPVCGRHRVEWNGTLLRCEKCTTSSEDDGFVTARYKANRDTKEQLRAAQSDNERLRAGFVSRPTLLWALEVLMGFADERGASVDTPELIELRKLAGEKL